MSAIPVYQTPAELGRQPKPAVTPRPRLWAALFIPFALAGWFVALWRGPELLAYWGPLPTSTAFLLALGAIWRLGRLLGATHYGPVRLEATEEAADEPG